ncbi:hypothetical protein ONE63_002904 [Megalurothrips usitatus]|uniref:E3 ubiquitin-protein ligase E3D n=1 Tax=Megalurothrips usitatus TaxID=439358 RepID=A0AAV7X5N8_9NEOP|nr:hypothetical protein ONE63_002904 [Megalurothrips usitatus]
MDLAVLLEVRPIVQACWVYLRTPSPEAQARLSVRSNDLTVTWSHGSRDLFTQTVSLPPEASTVFQPCEMSSLQQEEKHISFRIQTSPKNMTGSFALQFVEPEQNNFQGTCCAPDIPLLTPCVVVCSCCDHNILSKESVTFKRVLPLPSCSYDASDFFCHNHGDSAINVNPTETDFLYSTFGFHLHLSLLKSKGIVIHCKRCLSWIGTSDASRAHLWFSTVNVKLTSASDALVRKLHPAQEFILVIKEAIKQCPTVVCRIILSVKVRSDVTHYLLIHVIDRQLTVLTACSSSSIELVSHNVIKVSFHMEQTSNKIVSEWLNDSLVTACDVSLPVFVQGLKLLSNTSQLIPCTYRKVQHGFFLAYLSTDLMCP